MYVYVELDGVLLVSAPSTELFSLADLIYFNRLYVFPGIKLLQP